MAIAMAATITLELTLFDFDSSFDSAVEINHCPDYEPDCNIAINTNIDIYVQ